MFFMLMVVFPVKVFSTNLCLQPKFWVDENRRSNDSSFCLLASLASSLSDDLLAKATVEVVQLLKNKGPRPEMTRTNIQMIGALR